MHRLVVVPHTHWDREWYRTHEEFRYRLVGLLDGLLDLLDADPGFRHFMLDGQTVVVDDYLEVRPQARERLERLVRAGRLAVGPWYVLPDEWLVSGEALIRNLRLGLARAAALGGSMRLGYAPDQFGHVGQLPQVFAGFGLEGAALWRGVGRRVDRTLFEWEAPDGTRLLTLYLIQGYGNAAHLPLAPEALACRLEQLRAALAPHSPGGSLLLMNGSDHLEPQAGLPAALAAAQTKLEGARVELGTLTGFFERAREEAAASGEVLPRHTGELRSGLRAPLLVGCASARLQQKRAEFRNDALLTRRLEPLCAWLGELGGDPDPALLAHAWRIALQNHPHDSICGCSVDAVHDQMDTRFARVAQVAETHLRRVASELGARVRAPETGFGAGARDALIAWNPHAAGRAQVEGSIDLEGAGGRSSRLHLRRCDGSRLPARASLEQPAATLADYRLPASAAAALLRGFPEEFEGLHPCALRSRAAGEAWRVELLLGSEPRSGFDFASAKQVLLRRLGELGESRVRYRVQRLPRVRLRFVDDLPGHGLRVYRLAPGRAGAPDPPRCERDAGGGAAIANAFWRIEADPDGGLRCQHLATDTRIEDALRLVSEGDRGDLYNFDPLPDAPAVQRPESVRLRVDACEAEAELVVDARYRVPARLARGRSRRSARQVILPARLTLRLCEGLDRVDVGVDVDNTARDHRLRAHLRAPFRAERFDVESAFEVARRPIAPGRDAFGPGPAEQPLGTTPQRAFATLSAGARAYSVANRGSSEVEAVHEPDGNSSLAVTVLRAVGWLARGDLALRPSPAGPLLETPGAQLLGPQRAELSFRLHAANDPARSAEAHRFGQPAWLFAGGGPEGPLADGSRLFELDDPEVVVSAVEPRPSGNVLLRCYNASPRSRRVRLRWRGGRKLAALDLAERPTPDPPLQRQADASVMLSLRPWQIVSLLASD